MNGERRDIVVPDVVRWEERTASNSSIAEGSSIVRILKRSGNQETDGDECEGKRIAGYAIDT